MLQRDFDLVFDFLEPTNNPDLLEKLDGADTLILLKSDESDNLANIKDEDLVDRLIGFSKNYGYEIGDLIKNPYDKYSTLMVVECDEDSDRILVELRNN